MRSMKKLSIFVSIVMIFNLVVIPVFADNSDKSITINMISSTDTVQPGDTFEVDVNLSSNESFHSGIIGFDLSFNSNIFEYSDVNFYTSIDELGNNSSDWEELSGYNETTRHFVFGTLGTTVYAEGENTSNTVAKIFFRVKDKDEYGTQTIKIEKFNGVDSELNNLEASLPTIQISVVSDIVPTPNPTAEPTEAPTAKPTSKPSGNTNNSTDPTSTPTATPAVSESPVPTSTPEVTVAPTASPSGQIFGDVTEGYWAYSYIMDLYANNIVNGDKDGNFYPENNVTRAEFTKMAVSLSEIESSSTESAFTDVPADEWYAEYVAAAAEAGIVTGTSETTFSPDETVTREQMATIIGRKLNLISETASEYTDADTIADYALGYVTGLTEAGYLTGDDSGMFRPQATATRAESAALLSRVRTSNTAE